VVLRTEGSADDFRIGCGAAHNLVDELCDLF
jgi:hypothetical protein